MYKWLVDNIVGLLSMGVSVVIAYHLYFLSKRIGLRGRLEHKSGIVALVKPLLAQMATGRRRKVELVNAKVYPEKYLGQNKLTRHGYPYLGAELKDVRFDGLEFFCEVVALYRNGNGTFALEQTPGSERLTDNAFVVGIIPYEWIEFVDVHGDEYSYRPQFFTYFKGRKKSPYKYLRYYRKSGVYHEGSDPVDMQWTSFEPTKRGLTARICEFLRKKLGK